MTIARVNLTEAQIKAIMCKVADGEEIVAHFVPSRQFRIVKLPGDKTFRVEQLSRQAGDKWLPLSSHTGTFDWESFPVAWNDASEKQKKFLLEMRRLQIDTNQKAREHAAQ